MDLCLTARMMDAQEAERAGLVSRVVPLDKLMEEAMAVAEKIAGYSLPVVMMIKESINRAYETTLAEGVLLRAAPVPFAIRARGPEGGHGRLPREAQAELQEPLSAVYLLLAAHILSMLGFSTYAALLPELRDEWGLSNAEAGVVSGMFFAGYIGTVSLWTALTDRVDARKVYVAGSLLAAIGSAGFGLIASGFASALLFQVLLGVGIAATYMPGLRLLSDRVSGPYQSRSIAFYTSFFGIGTALSLALAGFIAPAYGWPAAFVLSGLGPLAAGTMVLALAPVRPAIRSRVSLGNLFPLHAWRRVLADRPSAGYLLGYMAHCLELFGSRAWMVAFLAYSASLHRGSSFPWSLAAIAAVVNLLAVPASIVGNEVALRIGRRRWILLVMAASGSSGHPPRLGRTLALAPRARRCWSSTRCWSWPNRAR